jgi:hypothetical protein
MGTSVVIQVERASIFPGSAAGARALSPLRVRRVDAPNPSIVLARAPETTGLHVLVSSSNAKPCGEIRREVKSLRIGVHHADAVVREPV